VDTHVLIGIWRHSDPDWYDDMVNRFSGMLALDDRPPTGPVAPAGTQATYEGAITASAAFRDITSVPVGGGGRQGAGSSARRAPVRG
jgi:hypothetical protein